MRKFDFPSIEGSKTKNKHNENPLLCLIVSRGKESSSLVNILGITRKVIIQTIIVHQDIKNINQWFSEGEIHLETSENYKYPVSNYFGYMFSPLKKDPIVDHKITLKVSIETYNFIVSLIDKLKSTEGIKFHIRGDWKLRKYSFHDEFLISWLDNIEVVEKNQFFTEQKIELTE